MPDYFRFFRAPAAFAHHGAAVAAHHVTLAETYTGRGWVTAWLITAIVLAAIGFGIFFACRAVKRFFGDLFGRRRDERNYYTATEAEYAASRATR